MVNFLGENEKLEGIEVALSLGSNIGDSISTIKDSVKDISKVVSDVTLSSLYRTEPLKMKYQADFVNAAITGKTTLSPASLMLHLQAVEKKFGRVREIRYGPRTLDIDIIFFGERDIDTDFLKIPHPEFNKRLFVMVPLCEIAPDLQHPVERRKISDIFTDQKGKLTEKVEKI